MSKMKQRRKRGVILSFRGLEKIEAARLKSEVNSNWGKRYTYEKLSELSYLDINTIKKILIAKEGVDKRSLESFFVAFELQLDTEDFTKPNPHKRQDWDQAVCVGNFYGRALEQNILQELLLKERCRIVTILGMGGIGKTTLSIKLAQQVQDRFDCIVWRSLRDAPPLDKLLANIIQFLSQEQLMEADLPESTGGRISCLINYLRSLRCLIVFDNLESVLCGEGRAGFCQEGYEGYGELLRRIGETNHQSCVLLTTREKPKQIAALEGDSLPVRTLKLKGLQEQEVAEILKVKGISGSNLEISTLVKHYSGNALALKMVATTISELFGGNIQNFLSQKTAVFGDVRELLDQQFERLSSLERSIIYWLAINRDPITISELQEDMMMAIPEPRIPQLNLIEGLEFLSRRSLIEQNESCFTLQSVVMEYVNHKLIEQACQEIDTQQVKFLRCFALMKATAKDFIKETQVRFILQPIIEGLMVLLNTKKDIEKKLTKIIFAQRANSSKEPGYTVGNAINLLCHLKTDLNGYDLSNLYIWQADFRNVCLHDVNFQNANLAKSVFAETFGGVFAIAFSPNGQILATGDSRGDILLRRIADNQLICSFKAHNSWIVSLAFSPDGQTLASSSCDCSAKLWDVNTGKCLHNLEDHQHEVWSVNFSPDSKTLVSGCDDSLVRLWQVSSGECLQVFRGHSNSVLSAVFTPDGKKLISGSDDNKIKIWNIETGECTKTFQGHQDSIRSLSVSPDGKLFASSSIDCTIRLWDINTSECIKVLEGHSNGILDVTFSPDGQLLASGSIDRTVRLWQSNTGKCIKVLEGHSNYINSNTFNAQGNILASGSVDHTVRLWNVTNGECIKTFNGCNNQLLSVVSSPDGKILASGGHDRNIKLWDLETGKVINSFEENTHCILSVAFVGQDNLLASSSEDKTIKLWDVKTGKVLQTLHGHQAAVRSVTFNEARQILASGSEDRTVRIWDINNFNNVKVLQGHQADIWSVAFSSDGKTLLSGSWDRTAKLWNTETGECLKTLEGHKNWVWSVAFSPDNKMVATTSPDQTVRIWNAKTGACQQVFSEGAGCSLLVAFSNNSQIIASCNQDHKIRLWRVDSQKCDKILSGHKAIINSLAFCPNSSILISSSEDETIKLWDINSGNCIKSLDVKRPYEGVNLMGVKGLTSANINTLKLLGATV